jgi:hypothetical protein
MSTTLNLRKFLHGELTPGLQSVKILTLPIAEVLQVMIRRFLFLFRVQLINSEIIKQNIFGQKNEQCKNRFP